MSAVHDGKVALVTGAAGGIGLACARRLAREGASVVMVDNQADLLHASAIQMKDYGPKVQIIVADVAKIDEATGCVDRTVGIHGRIDIIVNAAGIQPYGRVTDTTPDVWDLVHAVNLRAVYLIAGRAIPHMASNGGGAIINIASVQSLACSSQVAAYAASKAGLLGLTRSITVDYARDGIRANAICPGSIDTPLLRFAADVNRGERTSDEMIAHWGAMHPIGRVGDSDEIASLVSFLAGPDAAFVNGTTLVADGGVMAKLGISLPE